MCFSHDLRALRKEKNYSKMRHPKLSVNAENTVNFSTSSDPVRIEEHVKSISHELNEEKIKANLGHRTAARTKSTLTQLVKKLIQEISACNSPTSNTCTQHRQPIRSPGHEVGISRALLAKK